ncbi:hypothetical protein BV22DRAFT_1200245 [Leucogyrophana mollusca]|uniref:Uncharacterized protein n=1 Tax=Leucogyrophana mollusca TaxID=85980 RepID=A0ACB8AWM7_9AGAM|nr:hypothetical protein BV22DRAFT_1200245 [Leucogyrophana mollusca]
MWVRKLTTIRLSLPSTTTERAPFAPLVLNISIKKRSLSSPSGGPSVTPGYVPNPYIRAGTSLPCSLAVASCTKLGKTTNSDPKLWELDVFTATDCFPKKQPFAGRVEEDNCSLCFTLDHEHSNHVESFAFRGHVAAVYFYYDDACQRPIKEYSKSSKKGKLVPVPPGPQSSTTNDNREAYREMYFASSFTVCR